MDVDNFLNCCSCLQRRDPVLFVESLPASLKVFIMFLSSDFIALRAVGVKSQGYLLRFVVTTRKTGRPVAVV